MRRVREERKLLCVGVDLPIDAGTCGRFVHAGYQRCIHCTRRRWWLLTRALQPCGGLHPPRCSKTAPLIATLSTASRGGCSPALSPLRRSPPPQRSKSARPRMRRSLRRPGGRPDSRGRRRSLPALVRFRARDGRQCSDTAASLPASPLDLPPAPASPGWQPHARHVIPEIVEQHDTCCDYHRPDHDRPDPVPARSPPLRHTRRASPAQHECDQDDEHTSIKLTEEATISNWCRGASDPVRCR